MIILFRLQTQYNIFIFTLRPRVTATAQIRSAATDKVNALIRSVPSLNGSSIPFFDGHCCGHGLVSGVICFQDIGPVANWNVVKHLGVLTGSNSV